MSGDGEAFYWTGAVTTDPCGCIFHELAAADEHCEPMWLGKTMCPRHIERASARVRQLQAEGKLPPQGLPPDA